MGYLTDGNEDRTPDESSSEVQGAGDVGLLTAFGDEGSRLEEARDRYVDGSDPDVDLALHEPTARQVASAFLHASVRVGTRTDAPHDGPTFDDALEADPAGPAARERAAERRDAAVARMADRLQRALDDGDLPPDADPDLLARHLVTVSNGLAVQAGGGVGADELHQVVDVALRAWLPA